MGLKEAERFEVREKTKTGVREMSKIFIFSGSVQSIHGIDEEKAKEISEEMQRLLSHYGEVIDNTYILSDFDEREKWGKWGKINVNSTPKNK